MMPRRVTSRFPDAGWAWPKGGRDLLLKAAIVSDEVVAREAFLAWLAGTDLNEATYSEHRLLSVIVERHRKALGHLPEFPRLIGLQKQTWTRSMLTVRDVLPGLSALTEVGMKVVLIKGAARVALDPGEQKTRAAHDVDILLAPDQFATGVRGLLDGGWESSRGESAAGLMGRISSAHARNLVRGHFGDIDVHQFAYHGQTSWCEADSLLYDRLVPAEYYGHRVYVPAAEERIAIALAHGASGGHDHSDWLVDIAQVLSREALDWAALLLVIRTRQLKAAAWIALTYLVQEIGLKVPDAVLQALDPGASRWRPGFMRWLLHARPASDLAGYQRVLSKSIAGAARARASGRDKARDTRLYRAFLRNAAGDSSESYRYRMGFPLPDGVPRGVRFRLEFHLDVPANRHRLEYELNAKGQNLCHLQAVSLSKSGRQAVVRFAGRIAVEASMGSVELVALPGKHRRSARAQEAEGKYVAIPFRNATFSFDPVP